MAVRKRQKKENDAFLNPKHFLLSFLFQSQTTTLNLLLVTEFLPRKEHPLIEGGVQARTFFLTRYLSKTHHVQSISFNQGKIHATTPTLFPRIGFALNTLTAIPKPKPDIVEGSNVATFIPAFLLAKRLKVPAVAWVPDVLGARWNEYFSPPVALGGRIGEWCALKLPWDHLIAMSQATRKKLVKMGVDPRRITVIYGGVEYQALREMKVEKYPHPSICSISRLVPYKRVVDLIEAVRLARAAIPHLSCRIIGEGPLKTNLQAEIRRLRLSEIVELLRNIPHPQAMQTLKRSHVFCLPSELEGFGIVTVEAMAAGVPYVNARIEATLETTHNGKGGLLFRPRDPSDLAEKIIRLFQNSKLYAAKRREGMNLAREYDWSIIARETERVYESLHHRRSRLYRSKYRRPLS